MGCKPISDGRNKSVIRLRLDCGNRYTLEIGMWNFVWIILFYGLYNDAVSSSGYIAPNGNE
jgi:hypothetical protein